MIQSVLTAHGIDSIIPGASSASLTTAAVGFSSRVLVDIEVAEEAAALIAELRRPTAQDGSDDEDEEEDDEDDDLQVIDAGAPRDAAAYRRMMAATLCASVLAPMAAGHLMHRAYGRAMVLTGMIAVGVMYIPISPILGTSVLVAAKAVDAIGAVMLLRRRFWRAHRQAELPLARTVSRTRYTRTQ